MLTDESINIAQNLLHNQFPLISRFNDSCLGKTQHFDVVQRENPYTQIIHAGSLHWVCLANTKIGKRDNQSHYLYDSLSGSKIMMDIIKQIASYSFHPSAELVIHTECVQQQRNGVDCGLYAIAFATSLAFGKDPTTLAYDETQLRTHLVRCLEAGRMSEFPTINGNKRVVRCRQFSSTIELYCTCRLPYFKSSEKGMAMAQCDGCLEWFHRRCKNIPDSVFTIERSWKCEQCK